MLSGISSLVSRNPASKVIFNILRFLSYLSLLPVFVSILLITFSDAIVTRFEVLKQYESAASRLLPFAVEASWITGRWDKLQGYLELCASKWTGEFNVGIGSALNALRQKGTSAFVEIVNELRLSVAKSLTANSVASLQSCHDDMLRLHALADVEAIVHAGPDDSHPSKDFLLRTLNRRLDVLGGYLADKQYLLGLRRAAMELAYVCVDAIRGLPY